MKAVVDRRSSAATFYGSWANSFKLCLVYATRVVLFSVCMHNVGTKQHHMDTTASLFQLVEGNYRCASVNNGKNKQNSTAGFATHCIVASHQD